MSWDKVTLGQLVEAVEKNKSTLVLRLSNAGASPIAHLNITKPRLNRAGVPANVLSSIESLTGPAKKERKPKKEESSTTEKETKKKVTKKKAKKGK